MNNLEALYNYDVYLFNETKYEVQNYRQKWELHLTARGTAVQVLVSLPRVVSPLVACCTSTSLYLHVPLWNKLRTVQRTDRNPVESCKLLRFDSCDFKTAIKSEVPIVLQVVPGTRNSTVYLTARMADRNLLVQVYIIIFTVELVLRSEIN